MSKKFKIGIDYGGTKIEGILLNDSGDQIKRKRYSYVNLMKLLAQKKM